MCVRFIKQIFRMVTLRIHENGGFRILFSVAKTFKDYGRWLL